MADELWTNSRLKIILVVGAFVAFNLALTFAMGVRTGIDTSLYQDGADRLLHGEPLVRRQPSYIGYVAVLALVQWIHVGSGAVIALQVAAGTMAAVVVYLAGAELGGTVVGMIAVALLSIDVDTNRWHGYVLSDSLFASMLTIAVWTAYRAAQSPAFPSRWLVAATAVVAAGLIRPEGWFLVPLTATYAIITAPSRRHRVGYGAVFAVLSLLGFALVVPRLGGNVSEIGPNRMLRAGQTVWGYDGWRVPMPDDESFQGSESAAAVAYAVRHPVSTVRLMAARVVVHLAHVRPFYSPAHNGLILIWLTPVYAFAAFGWWNVSNRRLAWWFLSAISSQTVVVALGHADWDGRYLSHVLALMYPYASVGCVLALRRVRVGDAAAPPAMTA